MKLKFVLVIIFFILYSPTFSQNYIKVNAVTALVLVPNVGFETKISKHFSFHVDVNASFWKSINGQPFQFVMVIPEIRYHFKETFNGFYLGTHLGGSYFKLQKWGYTNTNIHQEGYNYLMGFTVGYQKKIGAKFMLEAFLGGGNQQAFYKGYNSETGLRSETAKNFNKSGEWLPYRGGIMICYQLN